jgi:RNA polymerase sigma-70 factor, ECF subfamily
MASRIRGAVSRTMVPMEDRYGADVRVRGGVRRVGWPWRSHDPLADPKPLIRRVYSYVAYRIGEGPDAEDVTSAVFERAVRYRESYDGGRGDPTAWVLGIARRALAEHLGRPVPIPMPDDAFEDVAAGPEEQTIHRLTLEEALAALSDRDRDLLSLRYGADLRAREIAAVLEIEIHAAEVALGRASARLRRMLCDAGM